MSKMFQYPFCRNNWSDRNPHHPSPQSTPPPPPPPNSSSKCFCPISFSVHPLHFFPQPIPHATPWLCFPYNKHLLSSPSSPVWFPGIRSLGDSFASAGRHCWSRTSLFKLRLKRNTPEPLTEGRKSPHFSQMPSHNSLDCTFTQYHSLSFFWFSLTIFSLIF